MVSIESRVESTIEEVQASLSSVPAWVESALTTGLATSGTSVSTVSALALPGVWSPVQRISGHMGLLPIEIRRRRPGQEDASDLDRKHRAFRLLNRKCNDIQNPMALRETLQIHALINGNGRAWIERDQIGRPIGLLLLPSSAQTVMVYGEKWHTFYLENDYRPTDSRSASGGGRQFKVQDADVFHIPGFSLNGLWGVDLVSFLRTVFGNDKAGQDSSASAFRNNGRPGLLLETGPGQLRKAKDAEEFLEGFNAAHTGVDNAGKVGLIREGMKAHVLPVAGMDANFMAQRNFSREDLAMVFGTEALLGSSSVYKNLSERQTAYYQNCLLRWAEKWEEETERKLLSVSEFANDTVFARVNPKRILQGDLNTLADYTGKLRAQGAASGNDVRIAHQLNPVDGLDSYENPNISSGTDPGPSDTEPDDDTPDATTNDNEETNGGT
jgi:HK97 family phage portal protein